MGWFWADAAPAPTGAAAASQAPKPMAKDTATAAAAPPAGCPMHNPTLEAFTPSSKCRKPADSSSSPSSLSACPVPHAQAASSPPAAPAPQQKSILSQLNPLNYMFPDLSQEAAPNQSYKLPTSREESSIPRSDGNENWEYPSPQQMYNALLRKGYTDTDITAVEEMVAVHNFLNEGAWDEVVGWERRFAGGLMKGWEACKKGEENAPRQLEAVRDPGIPDPTLIRFQGRPKDMTPKAALLQLLGRVYPSKYGMDPPFDRHDWYVSRVVNGEQKQVRYVIDYYSAPPEPTGEPVFYLDVRPAMTPTGAAERMIRWGSDVWWRASGAAVREESRKAASST